jgi:PEP-CTERM motif
MRRNTLTMSRLFRDIVATVTTIMLVQVTVNAGPVRIKQVIEVVASNQNTSDLRLRSSATSSASGSTGGTASVTASSNLLSGFVVESSDPKVEVIVDSGDVEGTICDCGDIAIAGGSFPKWPLLFFAAVPFFFIHDCDDCVSYVGPTPTPIPTLTIHTTPTTPVPEPASMLLMGSGLILLAAGLRRKYTRIKLVAQREEQ